MANGCYPRCLHSTEYGQYLLATRGKESVHFCRFSKLNALEICRRNILRMASKGVGGMAAACVDEACIDASTSKSGRSFVLCIYVGPL